MQRLYNVVKERVQVSHAGTVELVLRLPLTQADELLWEAAEQIGQMRAAIFFGTLLATGLVLFVCCARSR